MTAEFTRTSYERATREYDCEFQRRLTGEILNAIAQASIVSDPDLSIMALRDFIFGAQRQAGRA